MMAPDHPSSGEGHLLGRLMRKLLGRTDGANPSADGGAGYPAWVAYEPALIPPPELMRREAVEVLEEWFHWAEEWSMLLRIYGGMTQRSRVLEIGCGLGRVAYALRVILTADGSYDGFDVARDKIAFLEGTFGRAYPNFRFVWADVHNTTYNPSGRFRGAEYRFPYPDRFFDVVFAASVFTHLLPETAARYLQEAARVLRPGGHCVFSFFLLDHYRRGHPRPWGFAQKYFAFDHAFGDHPRNDFAVANPRDPENTSAYSVRLLERMAADAGLRRTRAPVPGAWSGTVEHWIGAQDVLTFAHAEERGGDGGP
jgi:SAM-dependent methyltransferase